MGNANPATNELTPHRTDDDFKIKGAAARAGSKRRASHARDVAPDNCTICLEPITDRAVAVPCNHLTFDFICLASWLQEQPRCPLCKAIVTAVEYDWRGPDDFQTYVVPTPPPKAEGRTTTTTTMTMPPAPWTTMVRITAFIPRRRPAPRPRPLARTLPDADHARHGRPDPSTSGPQVSGPLASGPLAPGPQVSSPSSSSFAPTNVPQEDPALARRRTVYRHRLFSLYVGANRLSHYRDFGPADVVRDPALQSRARMFLRRELRVFPFLGPDSSSSPPSASASASASGSMLRGNGGTGGNGGDRGHGGNDGGGGNGRGGNREFVLEFIVALLRTHELKGANGAIEEAVGELLGPANARLLLHELEAWLRSPYETLAAWDAHVQYPVAGGDRGECAWD